MNTEQLMKSVFTDALMETKVEQNLCDVLWQRVWPVNDALKEAAEKIVKDETVTDKQAAMRTLISEYVAEVSRVLNETDIFKRKEAEMADEQTQAELATLRKERDLHKALSELSDVQKAHYATLGESEQVEFLKGSRTVPADESFTDIDGSVIAKSAVGAGAFQVLKQQNARMAKMQDDLDMQTLTKRAETELKHLPGEVVAKARVLKAINKMPEAERATLDQILKAADAAAAPGFKPAAVAGEESTDPADKLEKMAKQHATDNKVSYSAAYTAVLATDEGKALYKEMQ